MLSQRQPYHSPRHSYSIPLCQLALRSLAFLIALTLALRFAPAQDHLVHNDEDVNHANFQAQHKESGSGSTWRGDGRPLLPSYDGSALREIWAELDASEPRSENKAVAKANTLQLQKQGPLYRGRLLSIEGRLLRADRVMLTETEGYYDLWILLPDSKRDPIRLLTRDAPTGFETDVGKLPRIAGDRSVKYRREQLRANAVYYRTTAYDAGNDFLTVPTFVGIDFTTTATSQPSESPSVNQTNNAWFLKATGILAVVFIWAIWRLIRTSKRGEGRSTLKTPTLFDRFNGDGGASGFLLFATLFATIGNVVGAETGANLHSASERDASYISSSEFWGALPGASPSNWYREEGTGRPRLDDETPESQERRELAFSIFGISERVLTYDVLVERSKFGDTTKLSGRLMELEAIPTTPTEEARIGKKLFYRATIEDQDGKTITIYTPQTPTFKAPPSFFDKPRERASMGLGEVVGAFGIRFGTERSLGTSSSDQRETPTFLATRLTWAPTDAPLGRLGVDLSAFEAVPVFTTDALVTSTSATERAHVAKSLRWTTADRRAFYGALAGYASWNPLRRERSDTRQSANVVSLFNEPEKAQGARVSLKGWARRVNMVLITDSEIKAATGLEKYYQIFLFTNESQGWPLTLCVPELPDGLEVGGGREYRRELEFDGFFYKTWAYKATGQDVTLTEADSTSSEEESARLETTTDSPKVWTRSPVLVGRILNVTPEDSDDASSPVSPTEIFGSFAILVCAWVALRTLIRRHKRETSLLLHRNR